MDALLRRLGGFDFRLVVGIGALLLIVLALEGWVLFLRAPLAAYRLQLDQRQLLELRTAGPEVSAGEIDRLKAAVADLEAHQPAGRARLEGSEDAIATTLIEVLDKAARAHRVSLANVRPDVAALPGQQPAPGLPKRPAGPVFSVGASGDYLSLTAWLLDFSEKFGRQARIDSFEIRAVDSEAGRHLGLELRLHLTPGTEGGAS